MAGANLRAERHGQLGAVLQERVEVPPFRARRCRVETYPILSLFDATLAYLEALIVLGPGGQMSRLVMAL